MKNQSGRKLKINKNTKQWKQQQAFAAFVTNLDRLPDAAEIRRNRLRSAPPQFIQMLF